MWRAMAPRKKPLTVKFPASWLLSLASLLACLLPGPARGVPESNAVQIENSRPGTTAWQLTNPAGNREIEGYASLTSVDRGGQIRLFVSTDDPSYTMRFFRMGWYGGAGGREVKPPVTRGGSRQPTPGPHPTTGLIECAWADPYVLDVPNDPDPSIWCSGVYLVQLTGTQSGEQSYIIFVVRDDLRPSNYLFQCSVTTYQAYNNWGGKSLYNFNSVPPRAYKVSFNRPYAISPDPAAAYGVGSGEFITNISVPPNLRGTAGGWEYNKARWLEREGQDVTYCTNIDTHALPGILVPHKGFLSVGHDEYWSHEIRQNLTVARDNGLSLGFFTANAAYWQVRFEPGTVDGAPHRTMVGYKEDALDADPLALDGNPTNDHLITTRFRDFPVNQPEDALLGVMYESNPVDANMVIHDASHWACAGTGLRNGDILPGLVGYEVDRMFGNAPPGTQVIARSPYGNSFSEMTAYTMPNGATVFATGSMQWCWGLDDFNAPAVRPARSNAAAQQITRNVLARFLQVPPQAPANVSATWDDTVVNVSWSPSSGAERFHVKRGTQSGGPYTVLASGVDRTFVDTAVTQGVTYYYVIAAENSFGMSPDSDEAVSVVPNSFKIECGGTAYSSPVSGTWLADRYFSGGITHLYTPRGVANTADPTLYHTVRYGTSFTYRIPLPNDAYLLRLHFAEMWFSTAGARRFNVSVNGTQVLSNFDILTAAGGANRALVLDFAAVPASGYVTVAFTSVTSSPDAVVAAIEAHPITQPPDAPTNLAASAGSGEVVLTWGMAARATSYHVKRANAAGGPYTTIASIPSQTTYTDTGLTNGSTYYYVVSGSNPRGESGNSGEVSARPDWIRNWKLECGDGVYSSPTAGSWVDDRFFSGGTAHLYASRPIANTSDPRLYLTARYGTSFTYTIPLPDDPYNVRLHFAELYFSTAGRRWFNVSINGNQVLGNFDIFTAAGGANRALVLDFPAVALNGSLTITFSSTTNRPDAVVGAIEVSHVTDPPAAPTGLAASVADREVLLTWNPGAASSYNVHRAFVSGGPYTTIATGVTQTAFRDTAVTNGTAYFYVVSGVNPRGESPNSNEVAATPAAITSWKIECGGSLYSSATAGTWLADRFFSGGSAYLYATRPIANTSDPRLYLTARYGTGFVYELPLPDGQYTLKLHFAELYFSTSGARRFHVSVNGTQVLTDFDIAAAAGGANRALIVELPASAVNGRVIVSFASAVPTRSDAVVGAIEVSPAP